MVYDPAQITYEDLLTVFWENHDPTQGMQQGIDKGSQYRSGIYYYDEEQKQLAEKTKGLFQQQLDLINMGQITTEIKPATEFYYAEDYHQQYLDKNPEGYCGLKGTGASCPIGLRKKNKE